METTNTATAPAKGALTAFAPALSIFARHSREELEGFIAVAIDLLDMADGDSDLEDATDAEDDFALTNMAVAVASDGSGCEVSDPGGCEHDGREHDDGY